MMMTGLKKLFKGLLSNKAEKTAKVDFQKQNFRLCLGRTNIEISLHELVLRFLSENDPTKPTPDEFLAEFNRLTRLLKLYTKGLEDGWEDFPFNWQKAFERGWLSCADMKMFREDLSFIELPKELNARNSYKIWEEWNKKNAVKS